MDFDYQSRTLSADEIRAAIDGDEYDVETVGAEAAPPPADAAASPTSAPASPTNSSVPVPAEEPGSSTAAAPADETPATGSDPAAPESRPEPKKGGFQRKLTRLEKERDLFRNEVEDLRRQLAEAKTSAAKPAETPAPAPSAPERPKWEDFAESENQLADYTAALVEFNLNSRPASNVPPPSPTASGALPVASNSPAAQPDEESKATQARWNGLVEEAKDRFPDWDQVTAAGNVPLSAPMGVTLFNDSDRGGELAYWLAKHPEEAQRIAAATTLPQNATDAQIRRAFAFVQREFGKIEDQLDSWDPTTPTPAPAPASREARPAPVAPPAAPQPAAAATPSPASLPAKSTPPPPPPPVPVGSRSAQRRTVTDMSDAERRDLFAGDPDAWRKARGL